MSIHTNLKPGDMFGRYRLESFLGAGGFAVVWKAYDTKTNIVVALKIFSSLDTQSINDLAAEYSAVHELSHPSIVRADYFDSIDNIPYLVMKFCSGGNLEHHEGRMSEETVLRMILQISEAMQYLHDQGLVHQDIKPANILTEETSKGTRFMLSDFGISAKSRTRLSKSVMAGAQSGSYLTYAYAPPEKFSPKKEDRLPNRKGDIFSLGITAYELICGYLPFDELPTGQQLQANPNIQLDYSSIRTPVLRNIIRACLLPNVNERPDAAMLINWIKNAQSGQVPPVYNGGNSGSGNATVNKVKIENGASNDGKKTVDLKSGAYNAGGGHGNYGHGGGGSSTYPHASVSQMPVENKPKKSKVWIWAVVIFLLIFVVAFVVGVIIQSNSSSYSPSDSYDYMDTAYVEEPVEAEVEYVPAEEVPAEEAAPAYDDSYDSYSSEPDYYVTDSAAY